MKAKQTCGAIVALCVAVVAARASSLELKTESLIKGKFIAKPHSFLDFRSGRDRGRCILQLDEL